MLTHRSGQNIVDAFSDDDEEAKALDALAAEKGSSYFVFTANSADRDGATESLSADSAEPITRLDSYVRMHQLTTGDKKRDLPSYESADDKQIEDFLQSTKILTIKSEKKKPADSTIKRASNEINANMENLLSTLTMRLASIDHAESTS